MFHIKRIVKVLILLEATLSCFSGALGQLPDDIQRELNQNLAEQAKIQAMRQQHQQQIANRASGSQARNNQQSQPPHDPNNYSYQQISPPIQYSYYQPYGDAAAQPNNGQNQQQAPMNSGKQAATPAANFDLNNLNFDMPQPQAQAQTALPQQQQHYTPSFTGTGGLPVLKPIANPANVADNSYAPAGSAPLAPQARVQQGPPLSEADFKDITGGENYGAPGESDFGLGAASGDGNRRSSNSGGDTDAQLREFGLPGGSDTQNSGSPDRRFDNSNQMNIPDFGAFGPLGVSGARNQARQSQPRADEFGIENLANGAGMQGNANQNNGAGGPSSGTDFDFAGQPSSRGDQAASTVSGGAPGSLQSLLGSGFPGLGGNSQSGLDDFARGGNNPQLSGQNGRQRADDGALDVANLGDKSDQFSGADFGGFEQPTPQDDQDFNYASPSNQQPKTVPYPDSNPQPVGTLWALTQPQSLSQTRYNAQVDRGTYQDYPAYQGPGNDFEAVREVVDHTPRARAAGPGRYGTPSPNDLAPEHRPSNSGEQFDYNRGLNAGSNEEEFSHEGYD